MYDSAEIRGYKKPSNTPAMIETIDMDLKVIATSCRGLQMYVLYRCLKEELIYFEDCVDLTFLLKKGFMLEV